MGQDDSGGDDLIGEYVITHSGVNCATFEWETHPNNLNGETNPDVYVQLPFEVSDTGNNVTAMQINEDDELPRNPHSWRDGPPGDEDKNVAVNCQTGSNCYILPYLVPTTNTASTMAKQIMALDSIQRVLETFSTSFVDDFEVVTPCTDSGLCPDGVSFNDSPTRVHVASPRNGDTGPHEVGHLLQRQRWDDNLNGSDCSFGPGDANYHELFAEEYESCATIEGFAGFVAVASWYEDDLDTVDPKYYGNDVEEPTPTESTCSDNKGIEFQVVKGFWDLADSHADAAAGNASKDDTVNIGERTIVNRWDTFDKGTNNRETRENDPFGPNLRDYFVNSGSPNAEFPTGTFNTLLNHNCLGTQSNL